MRFWMFGLPGRVYQTATGYRMDWTVLRDVSPLRLPWTLRKRVLPAMRRLVDQEVETVG